jgi:hypothetical protein
MERRQTSEIRDRNSSLGRLGWKSADSRQSAADSAGRRCGPCENDIMEFASVTCPTCFECFDVALPMPDEQPAEIDYDCEICCRPMLILFCDGVAEARGLAD